MPASADSTTPSGPTRETTAVEPKEIDVVRAALRDDYEGLLELGRGGMAVVYRARERHLDRDVALKVLPIAMTFDADFVERFQREAKTAAGLEHPHIIPIYRVGRSGQVIYFAMKLLRGESLSDRLRATGPLPIGEVRRVLMETASALGYAASKGVVHRDVKPDNIMLEMDGRCTVTDFGIARSMSDTKLTAAGMSLGTPRYMSPEQARSKPLDGRSDLYSLGIVGYECLVGRTPFDGDDSMAILLDHIQTPLRRPALVSRGEHALFDVIERLLEKEPDARYQSSDRLIAALAALELSDDALPTSRGARQGASTRPMATLAEQGPRSSPALDRGLAAVLDLLRRQRPKLDAGMRALRAQRPRLDAGIAAGRGLVSAQIPRATVLMQGVTARAGGGRRLLGLLAGGAVAAVAVWYGVHFAVMHRSRCPAADGKANSWAVLLDTPSGVRTGSKLDVYYDVCGLARGASFTARLSLVRQERGLRGLIGRSESMRFGVSGSASGPATRRHETIDARNMPAGRYTLFLTVMDASGRRRERETEFDSMND